MNLDDPQESDRDEDDHDVETRKSFGYAISVTCKIPNLDEIEIQFSRECTQLCSYREMTENEQFRSEILGWFSTALQKANNFKSLTINHLQDLNNEDVFGFNDFAVGRS